MLHFDKLMDMCTNESIEPQHIIFVYKNKVLFKNVFNGYSILYYIHTRTGYESVRTEDFVSLNEAKKELDIRI